MPRSAQSSNLKRVNRPAKLNEQVEEQLKQAILKQVFGPGELLPSENELTQIFGVSRSVIREALLMLSTKGLIEVVKGRGAIVTEPSIDSVVDPFSLLVDIKCGREALVHILAVRLMIEPSVAAESARNRTDSDILKIQECLDLMGYHKSEIRTFSHYDIHFHQSIMRSCNNPAIPIVLEPIFHVLSTFHPHIFVDDQIALLTIDSHTRIFEAIRRQDAEGAFVAMREHLEMAKDHNNRFYQKKTLDPKLNA